MSRSNGPGAPQAGWPAQRPQPAEPELPGFDPHQQGRWQQPAPAHPQAQPHYGQGQPAAAPQPAYGGHYQQGYGGFGAPPADPYQQHPQMAHGYAPAADPHDPYAPRTGGHGAAHGYDQGYPAQPHYQPQPAAYEPPPAAHHYDPHAQPGYGAPQAGGGLPHGGVPSHDYGYAQSTPQHPPVFEQQPAYAQPAYAAPELRGAQFDQWPQAAPGALHADAGGYDRAGYGAPQAESARWSPEPQAQPHHDIYGQPQYQPAQYQQPAFQQPQYQQPYQPPSMHPGYPADLGVEAGQGGELEPTAQHDDAADYEIEEPKGGRRWMMIAAALVGAIAVGGGMTYGYNKLFGKQKQVAEAPVVKNTSAPTKVKPAEPGGKQFAHTESKIMGRLNDGGAPAAATAAAADTDPSGARKVQTVIIGRDGSVQGGAAGLDAPAAPAPAGVPKAAPVSVPGMTIVDGFGGRPPSAAIAAAAPAPPVAAAPPAPARPVVVNPPAPPSAVQVAPPPPVTSAAPPVAAAPPRPPVAPKTVAALPTPRTDVPAAAAEAAPPAAKKVVVPKKVAAAPVAASGGNGYVAVLASVPASQKSNMEALKQFADMQQKYGTALANKTPEVREANLGDKGTYHRLLVGPPGSREAAGQLCAELRSAGYSSCWVTAY